MPCYNKREGTHYHEYVDIMNEIEQMIYASNSMYVICVVDFNTDILRNTPHSLKF